MSSVVIVQCSQGFVVSADSIVFKLLSNGTDTMGKVRGTTHKIFQLHDDLLVAAVGNWNSYFPVCNAVARLSTPSEMLTALFSQASALRDSKVYILSRISQTVRLDCIRHSEIARNQPGEVMYPEPILNSLFLKLYESPEVIAIRNSGMLGMASFVTAYNAFASSLCADISHPFDTLLFLREGSFPVAGSAIRLPTLDFL